MVHIKMPKKIKVETVYEDEPYENDRIKCPKCNCIQEARVYPDRKVNKKLHRCIKCNFMIHKKDWQSLKPAE